MRFKVDWASVIVGSKFTVFALYYFEFEGNFPSTSPRGLIFGGAILRRVFCVMFGGRIFGGAYTRRAVFLEFYSIEINNVLFFRCLTYQISTF